MLTPEEIRKVREAAGASPLRAEAPGVSQTSLIDRLGLSGDQSQAPAATPALDTSKNTPGFGDRVYEDFLNRTKQMAEADASKASGKQGFWTNALRNAGSASGFVNDVLSEGLRSTLDTAWEHLPDPAKHTISSGVHAIMSSPLNQAGLEALHGGQDKYEEWAKVHPEAAKNIESVINIGQFAATAVPATEVVEAAPEIASSAKGVLKDASKSLGISKDIANGGMELPKSAKSIQTALEAITPNTRDLTPTQYGDLLHAGRVTPKTATDPARFVLTDQEKTLAQKFEHLLQSKDPVKNINNLLTDVISKDDEVGTFLRKQSKVYIKNDLRKSLSDRLSQVNDVTIPKSQLSSARKDLLETIMSRIPENNSGRTFDKLWEFRKSFDKTIESKLNAFAGAPTLKKEMGKAIRDGIQSFIAENTPKGVYANKMKDMTQLYDLMDLVGTRAVREKGLSGLRVWIRDNPSKAKALKWTLGVVGLGLVGDAALH